MRARLRIASVLLFAAFSLAGGACDQPCKAPSNVCTGKDSTTGEYTPKGCVVWNGC